MEKGSSSSSSSSGGGDDSFNGLKFGKKIYFEGVGSGLQPKIGEEEEEAPPRSPAKKGRTGVAQGGQPPRCQVEGCKVDLSGAKAYYCRHKVCSVHSKSPMVIVAGLEQRFCQQCSRFHQLPEFDQGKRSCRRRLAGHNERRRKPPAGPQLSTPLSSSIFDNHIKATDFSAYTPLDSWPKPWQGCSGSQAPPPHLLQSSTAGPTYADEDCFSGISDSGNALSLLSNWGSTTQPPLDIGANANFLARHSWDFKADNSLHQMPPFPHLPANAPPHHPPGYDSSVHHINWSL